MVSGSYSFIDIAVLDQVRERLAAGDALAMLDIGLESLIWANGPGCQLFGYDDVETVMGAPSGLSPVARRQISAAPGFPRMRSETSVTVRMGGLRPVGVVVSGVTLPDGEPAVLVALPANHGPSRAQEEVARQAVSGFSDANSYAALIDEHGGVEASSTGFDGLGIAAETLESLVAEVRDEDDRLVKRLIPAAAATLAAGMARLTDDPARHLLLVIEADEAEWPTGEEAEPVAELPVPDFQASIVEDDPMPDDDPDDEAEDAAPIVAEDAAAGTEALSDEDLEETFDGGETPAASSEATGNSLLELPQDRAEAPDEAPADPVASTQDAPSDQAPSAVVEPQTPPAPPAREMSPTGRNGAVRFVWRTDAEGRFTSVSEEFATAIGTTADSFNGRTFREIAARFGLEGSSEIADLLERRDTWSGRTVIWPIVGSGLGVPVDLAALPIYDRARSFEGFRGFGVARMGDAAAFSPVETQTVAPVAPPADEADDVVEDAAIEDPFRGETPALVVKPGPERRQSDKIIRLAEHRPSNDTATVVENEREGGLSASERTAFRQIGERLKRDSDAGPADDLKSAAPGRDAPASTPVTQEPDEHVAEIPEPSDDAAPAPEAVDGPQNETADAPIAETAEAPAAPEGQEPPPPVEAETTAQHREPAPVAKLADIKAVLARADRDFRPAAYPAAPADEQASPTAILAGLPLAVLVHAGDELHFANREFFKLTGHESLETIAGAGGLDALFAEGSEPRSASGGTLSLQRADGTARNVTAHLHSIAWKGGKALMLALQPVAEPAAPASEDEDALRDRLYELRTIVDTATDGVVLLDKDGFIRSISRPAEALFGMDSRQVEGKAFATLFAIESQRAASDYLAGLADNGVASVLNDGREVIGREAQGRFIPLFMTMGRLPADSGYCAVLRDITNWKRAEEELTQARAQAERSSSQKTEFLARVSHEVRTPLNAIIGFSELMLDEKFGPIGNERYRDYLRDINRSGNHVLDLVNDLLDISKIEAGEQEMSYEAVSLNDSLAETVAMMQPQANRERVIIRSSFASRLPDVVADQRSVRQIALNLLSNAVRATPAGGQVIVSTAYEQSGDIVLRVRDTGIGMTIAEIEQALKPFKQINALKRARGEGTGLGLPLTKALVEANRARFHITSSPGQGTMVEITFPSTRVLAV
ncbi:MAG: ATP-binding protein [Rhizobiaceae bacterium]